MNDETLRKNGPPDTFDNTLIGNWTCPRQFYYFLRRIDYQESPAYFTFGRAFGQGINKWHEGQKSNLTIEERIFLAQEEARRIWVKDQPLEKGNDTFINLVEMIDSYCRLNLEVEPWITVAAEVGFKLPIPGTSCYYAGSLDSYIEWPGYGLLLREDKTTGGYLTQSFIDQWSFSSQITGYIWALAQILGEIPFGALMNMASKRPRKDPDLRFSRNLETRSDWKVKKFMGETVSIIDSIRRQWDESSSEYWTWPRIGERVYSMCTGGIGKSPCMYRNLCLLDMEPWEFPKNYSYTIHGLIEKDTKWEPWEREGEDD